MENFLIVLMSLSTGIAEIVTKPTATEVVVGGSTYLNCSSGSRQKICWSRTQLGSTQENFIYCNDVYLTSLSGRMKVEMCNEANGACNLVISSVEKGDAGIYGCQEESQPGTKATAQLIVLESDPVCEPQMDTYKIIGPNNCGIEPNQLVLSCTVTYHGNEAPVMEWRRASDNLSVSEGVTHRTINNNRVVYNLTIEGDSTVKDGDSYFCNTTRSATSSVGCTSGKTKVTQAETPICPNTMPYVAAIVVTWFLLIPIIVAASVVGGMYLQTRRPLKIFTRPERERHTCIEEYQTPDIHIPRSSDVVESTQPFIVAENNAKTMEEQAKQYEELKRTTMQLAKGNNEKELKLAQLEKKIKQLEKEKHELEARLYPQAIASYSKKPKLVSTIEIKDLKPNSTKDTKPIFGLMILHNKLFVVTEMSSDIDVYDSVTFNPEPRWPIPQMSNPLDIAGCRKNNCLYICESRSNEMVILRIDARQSSHTVLNTWSIGEEAGQLSVSSDGNVVVSLFTGNKIIEYSPEGKLIREVRLFTADNIKHPWHAIKSTSMHFIFSHGIGDDLLQRVCVAHADGKVVKSFGGKKGSGSGIDKEHMNRPVHILEDSSQNLLVADMKNNRVLLLSSTLEYKGILLSKENKLRLPMRLCLDEERGILFVADNDYTEKKYTYESGRILIFNCKKKYF